MSTNQAYIFLIFIINGIVIGLLFDFFRILRKTFNTKDFAIYIEDIIFWILTGCTLLYSICTYNNGEIRFYMFLGVILGIIIYMLFISSYIIKINVKIFGLIKNFVEKIIAIIIAPFKYLYKITKRTKNNVKS